MVAESSSVAKERFARPAADNNAAEGARRLFLSTSASAWADAT
jgi:hypothetical protein